MLPCQSSFNQAKTILKEGQAPPPGLIVGCTNPFFLKLASAWPHLCPAPLLLPPYSVIVGLQCWPSFSHVALFCRLCVGNGTGSECVQVLLLQFFGELLLI